MKRCKVCDNQFQPNRPEQVFCSIRCRQVNNGGGRKGQKTGRRKDEFSARMTRDGYLRVYSAHHPFSNGRKEMHEHQVAVEMFLGRALLDTECVHHINGDKTDNRLENLEVMTRAEHSSVHMTEMSKGKPRKAGRFA